MLDGAVAQARDRAAVRAVDLQFEELAAADEDRLRVEQRAVVEREAALVADGEQGTHEVLPAPHPAGDPVQGNGEDLARYGPAFHIMGQCGG